jgi:hypothetical protein
MWENGERGTPEQWKIKPKTIYLSLSLKVIFALSLSFTSITSLGARSLFQFSSDSSSS